MQNFHEEWKKVSLSLVSNFASLCLTTMLLWQGVSYVCSTVKQKLLKWFLRRRIFWWSDGSMDGFSVGMAVGLELGSWVGVRDGEYVGSWERCVVGSKVGWKDGTLVGARDGECVGSWEGCVVGSKIGGKDGTLVGILEGNKVGCKAVEHSWHPTQSENVHLKFHEWEFTEHQSWQHCSHPAQLIHLHLMSQAWVLTGQNFWHELSVGRRVREIVGFMVGLFVGVHSSHPIQYLNLHLNFQVCVCWEHQGWHGLAGSFVSALLSAFVRSPLGTLLAVESGWMNEFSVSFCEGWRGESQPKLQGWLS